LPELIPHPADHLASELGELLDVREGGHAIVGMLTDGADPVRKVSIIPRGLALDVTFAAPDSDRFNYREPEVEAKIKVALGGRAAEEVVFGERHRRGVVIRGQAPVVRAHHHLTLGTSTTRKQRLVESIGSVGRADDDHAGGRVEPVHLGQDLIQRLLALVVAAAEAGDTGRT
jgi:hypothetical protein